MGGDAVYMTIGNVARKTVCIECISTTKGMMDPGPWAEMDASGMRLRQEKPVIVSASECRQCGTPQVTATSKASIITSKPFEVLVLTGVLRWRRGMFQAWECPNCAVCVNPVALDIGAAGLVPVRCPLRANACSVVTEPHTCTSSLEVCMDPGQSEMVTCVDHLGANVLCEIRFGAHVSHRGYTHTHTTACLCGHVLACTRACMHTCTNACIGTCLCI